MPDTGNAKDCLELPPTNFSIFTLKNVTWRTYLISFTVQYCFLFRFVCIELVSLIWFLQIWIAVHVYGTMINWSTLVKNLMQTYIVIVSGSILNVSTVHLNGIWHLIWRYISKPVLGGHPVLSGHYSIPRGCPLNTGFSVLLWKKNWKPSLLSGPLLLFSCLTKCTSMIFVDKKNIELNDKSLLFSRCWWMLAQHSWLWQACNLHQHNRVIHL